MPKLTDKATAAEARSLSGLEDEDTWQRFLEITKDIAREMRVRDPDIKWRSVALNEKREVMNRINQRLESEEIPAVGVELIRWRMARVIGNLKYAEARSSKAASETPDRAVECSGGESLAAAAQPELEMARPYDPIRDV